MQHVKSLKLAVAAFLVGLGASAAGTAAAQDVIAVADGVNMWDGQWHFEVSPYAWVPWIYVTSQLPPIAGGGNPTTEVQPSQYLKYVEGGVLFDGSVRKGNWSVWTDLVYLNLQASPTHTREINLPGLLPGAPPDVSVNRTLDTGIRAAIWTLAPSYTVMNNDVGTLDVMVGLRYTSLRVSLAYEFTLPPTPLMRGGGFWPTTDSTDGLIGVKGALRLSSDGKWFAPYEADVGDGNKNWQYNAFVGGGYHFHWGDITLGVRNLTYNLSDRPILQKARLTGPTLGASFRW
ncbi:MAG: hypothetical protein ACLQAR_07975 [Steroidobacteraceae bacterium]